MSASNTSQPFRPAKIFVGYQLRVIDNVEQWLPEFTAPSNYKDETKIREYVESKKEEFLTKAAETPYLATFQSVCLIDPQREKALKFEYTDPATGKPSIAVRVRNYLVKEYAQAWVNAAHYDPARLPGAIFIGFDPKLFLKVLGLECSLPSVDKACPLRLWYGNSDHRDIEEAVCPKDYRPYLSLKTVLKLRRPLEASAAADWDKVTQDFEPRLHAFNEAMLSVELATQLGFLNE